MADLTHRLRTAVGRPKKTTLSVFEQVREDDVPFMAGSIAYQAFISLFPLLVLLFLVVAAVGNEAVAEQVVGLTEGVLPSAAQELLGETISGDTTSGTASVIGAVTLVWGSLKIFRGLDTAFSEIYKTGGTNSIRDQLHDGLIVFAVLVVSLVAMVTVGSVFAIFEGLLARVLNLVFLVVGLTVAFLPMYRFFPDADLSWAEAIPGALVAAIGWTVLQSLFQVYVALSGASDTGSVVGAVLLLLTWLYLGGLLLLLGAVVNAVLLGEGDPEPKTEEDEGRHCAELFHRERDRRQTLQHETARLERRLSEAEATSSPETVVELRARNRQLQRRLRWLEKPLTIRLLLQTLGQKPEFADDTETAPQFVDGADTPQLSESSGANTPSTGDGHSRPRSTDGGAGRRRERGTDRRAG